MADATGGGGAAGYNIGGGYVTVGVDLSGARQELAAFKQELGSYFAGSVVSPVGGGGLGAGTAAPAGGTQPGGAAGLPGIATPTAGGFAGFAGMPGAPGGQGNAAQPAGGGNGGGGQGGGGGGDDMEGMPWWMKNIFRPTTLFQQLGMPVGLFYGMETWGRVGQGIYQANFVRQHPEINAEGMAQTGSGLGLYNNPAYQGIIGQIQGIDEETARRQSLYQMPLLGGYLAAFDWGPGSSTELNYQRNLLQGDVGRMAGVAETNREVAGMRAQLTQDPVQVAQQEQRVRLASEREKVENIQREAGRAFTAMEASRPTYTYSLGEGSAGVQERGQDWERDQGKVDRFKELAVQAEAAAKALADLKGATDAQVNEVSRQVANATVGQTAAIATTDSLVGVQGRLINQGIMAQASVDMAVNEYFAHPTITNQLALAQAQAQQTDIQRQAQQYQYETHLQPWAVPSAALATQSLLGSYRAETAGLNAQLLAASNDPYGAQIAEFGAEQEGINANLNPASRARQQRSLDQRRQIYQARHSFELGVFNDTMEARQLADQDVIEHRPLTAQARTAVASAMAEVANAPSDQKETLIATLQKDLQTQRTMLTQQLGGQVAVDVNAYTAMGMPSALGLDLTGRQMDVSAAQGVYDKVNLNNARQAGSGQPGQLRKEDLTDVFGQAMKVIENLKAATVSMFTTQ